MHGRALALTIATAALLAGCGGSSGDASTKPAQTATQDPAPVATDAGTCDTKGINDIEGRTGSCETDGVKYTVVDRADVLRFDDYTARLKKVSRLSSVKMPPGYAGPATKPSGKFVVARLTLHNRTARPLTLILLTSAGGLVVDGNTYAPAEDGAAANYESMNLGLKSINSIQPKATGDVLVVFDVPAKVAAKITSRGSALQLLPASEADSSSAAAGDAKEVGVLRFWR